MTPQLLSDSTHSLYPACRSAAAEMSLSDCHLDAGYIAPATGMGSGMISNVNRCALYWGLSLRDVWGSVSEGPARTRNSQFWSEHVIGMVNHSAAVCADPVFHRQVCSAYGTAPVWSAV